MTAPDMDIIGTRPTQAAPSLDALPLFADVLATPTRKIVGMVRGNASVESQQGAVDALKSKRWVEDAIVALIAAHGPMTARELEHRPEFYEKVGRSTVSARLSDLKAQKVLVQVGRRDKQGVWGLAGVTR